MCTILHKGKTCALFTSSQNIKRTTKLEGCPGTTCQDHVILTYDLPE